MMDFKKMMDSTTALKAISDENRLRILYELRHGERCVCEIWKALGLAQNLTSHHLKTLKDAGLIKSRKVGLNVHYSIDRRNAKSLARLVDRLLTKNS